MEKNKAFSLVLALLVVSGFAIPAYADDEAEKGNPVTGFCKGSGEVLEGLSEGTAKVVSGFAEGTSNTLDGMGKGGQHLYEHATEPSK